MIKTLLKRKMKTTRTKPRTRTNLPPRSQRQVKRTRETPQIKRKMEPKLRTNKEMLKIKRIFENVSNMLRVVYML